VPVFQNKREELMSKVQALTVIPIGDNYVVQWEVGTEPPDRDLVLMSVELFKESIRILNGES
jgi:hypothetical protein